ncbi:serine/arginine repetitive matrix protein 2-like isoform X2 [Helicoverpa zea]|uniref:serine/arginine repetitive matrix protein 2-like isoform X2 n=1 Tax=Helicoverpa zea TaxID=7113 RepID=UPI001F5AADCB|nr:serine/arginine repetitive matrix protein 2-like isoform X2 [Helicoverpa zea]
MSSSDSDDDCYGNIAQKLQSIKNSFIKERDETDVTSNRTDIGPSSSTLPTVPVDEELNSTVNSTDNNTKAKPRRGRGGRRKASSNSCGSSNGTDVGPSSSILPTVTVDEELNSTVNSTDSDEYTLDAIIANNTKAKPRRGRGGRRRASSNSCGSSNRTTRTVRARWSASQSTSNSNEDDTFDEEDAPTTSRRGRRAARGRSTSAGRGRSTRAGRERSTRAARGRSARAGRGRSTHAGRERSIGAARGRSARAGRGRSTRAGRERSTGAARGRSARAGRGRSTHAGRERSTGAARGRSARAGRGRSTHAGRERSTGAARGRSARAARVRSTRAARGWFTRARIRGESSREWGRTARNELIEIFDDFSSPDRRSPVTSNNCPIISIGNTDEYPGQCENQQLFSSNVRRPSDDVEIVDMDSLEDDNEEMSVKVYWRSLQIFKFNIRKYQKITQLFNYFSEKEGVSSNQLLFTYNDKILKMNDTPDSINYNIAKFINGGIVNQDVRKLIAGNNENNESSGFKLKFQCQNKKKPFDTFMNPHEKLMLAMIKCAEHLETPLERLKFYFDGDLISSNNINMI